MLKDYFLTKWYCKEMAECSKGTITTGVLRVHEFQRFDFFHLENIEKVIMLLQSMYLFAVIEHCNESPLLRKIKTQIFMESVCVTHVPTHPVSQMSTTLRMTVLP